MSLNERIVNLDKNPFFENMFIGIVSLFLISFTIFYFIKYHLGKRHPLNKYLLIALVIPYIPFLIIFILDNSDMSMAVSLYLMIATPLIYLLAWGSNIFVGKYINKFWLWLDRNKDD